MQFNDSYFEEEVIDGYYVSSMMKHCWAAHLIVMRDLDEVCQKYGIEYYADWGTLLGCVRCGGVVPWDDDFDVCMKREDYNKFLDVWEKELGDRYFLRCLQTLPDRDSYYAKLVNYDQFVGDCSRNEEFAGFPYGMGVDIFILDYIAPDKEEDDRLCNLYNDIATLAYMFKNSYLDDDEFEDALANIEKRAQKKINRNINIYNELNLLADWIYSNIEEKDADDLTQMPIYADKRRYRIPKWCYSDRIYMNFEGIKIPVPIGYEEILHRKYGNYINPVKAGGSHDYPFYERQEDLLCKLKGRAFGQFLFDDCKPEAIIRTRLNDELIKVLCGIKKVHGLIGEQLKNLSIECESDSMLQGIVSALENCQQVVISVGNTIEKEFETDGTVVKELENYCEKVFELSQSLADETLIEMNAIIDNVCDLIALLRKSCNTVLVIPYREKYFDGLEEIIREYEEKGVKVTIMPIPYYTKKIDGIITGEYEPIDFSERLSKKGYSVADYNMYDLANERPNTIIIQNAFDQTNYFTTVAPAFYSENLKKCCEELIFVSPYDLDNFTLSDERIVKMSKDFINRPAILYSDKIIVHSENEKKLFANNLKKFAGVDYEDIWEEKIFVNIRNIPQKSKEKKKLLYFISFGEAALYKEKLSEKADRTIETLKKYEKDIEWSFVMDDAIREYKDRINTDCIDKIVEKYKLQELYVKPQDYNSTVEVYDAYFGDSGVLSNLFRIVGKPVMIENADL